MKEVEILLVSRIVAIAAAELFPLDILLLLLLLCGVRGVISIILLNICSFSFWQHFEHYVTLWMSKPQQLSIQIINKAKGTKRHKRNKGKSHSK